MLGDLQRSKEEIAQLALEIREHIDGHSLEFELLTFEEGVQATLKWLFYKNAIYPCDVKPVKKEIPHES